MTATRNGQTQGQNKGILNMNGAYVPNHKQLNLKIYLSQNKKRRIPVMGMIDSGAGVTTISPATVKGLGLKTIKENNALVVRNADGTKNNGGQ